VLTGFKWLKMGNMISCKDDDRLSGSIKNEEYFDKQLSAFKKIPRTIKLMWFEDCYFKSGPSQGI
jgi:hypothetical protein